MTRSTRSFRSRPDASTVLGVGSIAALGGILVGLCLASAYMPHTPAMRYLHALRDNRTVAPCEGGLSYRTGLPLLCDGPTVIPEP